MCKSSTLQLYLLCFISACVTKNLGNTTEFFVEDQKTFVEVPFELIDNRNFVEVFLDNEGPFKFILDTGGGDGIVITPEIAQLLETKIIGSKMVSGVGAEKQKAELSTVTDVRLNSIHLLNVKTTILSLKKIQDAIGFDRFDGIIGHELFSRFVTTIDFENNTLRFALPKYFQPPKQAVSVPLIIDGAPYVTVGIGNAKGRFLVDTGDRSSLSFCGPFTDKFALLDLVKPKLEAMTGYGVGGPVPAKIGIVKKIDIGNVEISNIVARFPTLREGSFASEEDAGIIGNGILKNFRVTFDYANAVMFLENQNKSSESANYDRSGMWIGKNGDSWVVFDVVKYGPADRAGIKLGDQIEKIDGLTPSELNIDEARARLRSSSPGLVKVTIGGTTNRSVTLKLRNLL
ncbi:MAG: hypothetical protein RJB66_2545 [Pseudomonadota bacterium]|jgi:hypothetical protein